ncbi:MAG TPA: cytochrome c1 [Gammaproteobacteria bacterium]|nr:cytochrome c1 [Gammaproteobacteria bacterium]
MMKRTLIALSLLALTPALAFAAEEGSIPMQPAHTDLANRASLQRGAKYFVNYCMGCHELKYVRFKRVAEDLQIPKTAMMKYLIMGSDASYTSMMTNAMPNAAAKWFGKTPPDLSVIARLRGADWIYNYLQDFYLDPSRPTGTNNLLLPNAAMPDVLWQLQGLQQAQFKTIKDADGRSHREFAGFKQATKGELTPAQFQRVVHDIANFLVYVGEPDALSRTDVGWAAIIFILVLLGLCYALKREIWRDVHLQSHADESGHSGDAAHSSTAD